MLERRKLALDRQQVALGRRRDSLGSGRPNRAWEDLPYRRGGNSRDAEVSAATTQRPTGLPHNQSDDDGDVLLTYDVLKGVDGPHACSPSGRKKPDFGPVDPSYRFKAYSPNYYRGVRARVFYISEGHLTDRPYHFNHWRIHRWDPTPRPSATSPAGAPMTGVFSFSAASSFLPSAHPPAATTDAAPTRRTPTPGQAARLAKELAASLYPAARENFLPPHGKAAEAMGMRGRKK